MKVIIICFTIFSLAYSNQTIAYDHIDSRNESEVLRIDASLSYKTKNGEKLLINHDNYSIIKKPTFQENLNLKELDLSDNKLESIEPGAFNNLKNLRELYLKNNRFKSLKNDMFASLNKLEILSLEENYIVSIESHAFNGLFSLINLELGNNILVKLYKHSFRYLNNLEILSLKNNQIDFLDNLTFANLSNLEVLKLNDNNIKDFQIDTFIGLVNLKRLSLNCNKLNTLKEYFFKAFHNLIELDLFGNQIERLDSFAFENLKNLRCLNLSNNSITTIKSDTFKELDNLEELDLRFNGMIEVDESILNSLSNIKIFTLSSNVKFSSKKFGRKIYDISKNSITYKRIILKNPPFSIFNFLFGLSLFGLILLGFIFLSVFKVKYGKEWNEIFFKRNIDLFKIKTIDSNIYDRTNKRSIYGALTIIDKSVLHFEKSLGSGQFGEVYEGYLDEDSKLQHVAIKKLLKANETNKNALFEEAKLLNKCHHPNLIKLYGISLNEKDELDLIIMEYMNSGDLLTHLRNLREEQNNNNIDYVSLVNIAYDISKGCEYLESINLVHRDIAARNCLLNRINKSKLHVKLGDFGLARKMYTTDYYRAHGQKELPIRWMAPESIIDGLFTSKSDVWSYGILLYEIFTLGNQPYPGMNNETVVKYLNEKKTLQLPDYFSNELSKLIRKCWMFKPKDRPSFKEMPDLLKGISDYDLNIFI